MTGNIAFQAKTMSDAVAFQVNFTTREGESRNAPLEILWKLIESYEVDIFEVSLSRITEDFIRYMQETVISLSEQAEFAYMGARLTYYKSRLLLPNPGFEDDEEPDVLPPDLVEQLLEYKRYQMAAEQLSEREANIQLTFARESNWHLYEEGLDYLEVDLVTFLKTFRDFLEKEEKRRPLQIEEEEVAIEDLMDYWREELNKSAVFGFFSRIEGFSGIRMITAFLAILELARLRECTLHQSEQYADIEIRALSVAQPEEAHV